jgi:hypothetical protein
MVVINNPPASSSGTPATPTLITAGTTYSVASSTQVVFTEEIQVDGELSIDGVLAGTF